MTSMCWYLQSDPRRQPLGLLKSRHISLVSLVPLVPLVYSLELISADFRFSLMHFLRCSRSLTYRQLRSPSLRLARHEVSGGEDVSDDVFGMISESKLSVNSQAAQGESSWRGRER
jgi:hypothetical protein